MEAARYQGWRGRGARLLSGVLPAGRAGAWKRWTPCHSVICYRHKSDGHAAASSQVAWRKNDSNLVVALRSESTLLDVQALARVDAAQAPLNRQRSSSTRSRVGCITLGRLSGSMRCSLTNERSLAPSGSCTLASPSSSL